MQQQQQKKQEPLPATFAEAMGDGYDPNTGTMRVEGPIGEKTSDGALDANERAIMAEQTNEAADKPGTITVDQLRSIPADRELRPASAGVQTSAPMATPPANVKEKAVVVLNAQGIPMPADFDAAYRVADAMFRGGSFPKWVKTAIQALAVSQFCRSLNLDPMTGVQHVCEVNGRLSLWGEGPLAAVRASGKLKSIREVFLTKDYKEICLENKNLDAELFACVCQVERSDGSKVERSFTEKDAKTAIQGLPEVWKKYPRVMWKRKARAEALKDLFGDVLVGAGIAEWDATYAPDVQVEGVVQPNARLSDRLNDRLQVEDHTGKAVSQ